MPHDIAIMYFFEQMNAFMLGHYLTEEYYMGKDQPDFFYSIEINPEKQVFLDTELPSF